ncbi:solute carrier family 49 member 4 homolog isoform X2 [Branchiostoma floridae]|uniref:Solute carrier family 49 member 4 homolog isoform X2 n=1 Tax=Branchiostoma floridae TaxID=7739 RepID=A0A9J7HI49_BRAFL|nr:solute carrier family 49 member 4 homolog isoform X2 [Branchiostoma floridae]
MDNVSAPDRSVVLYGRRWYVLAVFSLLGIAQGAVWNSWGPVSVSAKLVFAWKDTDIALLENWDNITYVAFTVVAMWILVVKGLRFSVVLTALLIAVGTGLRCIPASAGIATILINAGQFLNGVAGIMLMAAPPLISSTWFPPNQRTTATAISSIFNYVGTSVGYLIGPLFVSQPHLMPNSTLHYNQTVVEDISGQIMRLMYVECGYCTAVFLAILIYFPSKPPTPPSLSAAMDRLDFRTGLKKLFRHGQFWLVCLAYCVPGGVIGGWTAVLDVILSPHGISQIDAGWLGFYGNIAGCGVGLLLGRFADYFAGHLRLIIVVMMCCATGSLTWFTIMLFGALPLTQVSLYISFILTMVSVNASIPLFLELVMETTYPIEEAVSAGVMTWGNNLFALIFLLVPLLPKVGVTWMNWAALGGVACSVPLLCVFRENYRRLHLDTGAGSEGNDETQHLINDGSISEDGKG